MDADTTVDPLEMDVTSSSFYASIEMVRKHHGFEDSKDKYRFRMSLPNDPAVKEWLASLSEDERKELGLTPRRRSA